MEAAPDATRAAHVAQWTAPYGTALNTETLARTIRRIGWSRKKSLLASERDPWRRAICALKHAALDAHQIVVIDEVGSHLDLPPTHAWAPRGERAFALHRARPPRLPRSPTREWGRQ